VKAIVLSAGQGRRLLPLTEATPKCLLELAGRPVLEWQLRALAAEGVSEAVVVTGFGAARVDALVQGLALPGIQVRTLYNPFFSVADNLASCWIARGEMAGGFLILNGDTLFEPAIARALLQPPTAPITVTIDRKPAYDADDMKVELDGLRLRAIGKQLPLETVGGESIGFLRFTAEGGRRFVEEVERLMHTPEGLKLWYLSVIDRIARAGGGVEACSIEGREWGEMDFPRDLPGLQAMTGRWRAAADGQPAARAG